MHLKIAERAKYGLEKKVEIMEAMIIQIFAHECTASTALQMILRSSLSVTQRIQLMRDLLDMGVVNAVSKLKWLTENKADLGQRVECYNHVDNRMRKKELVRFRDNQTNQNAISGFKSEGNLQTDLKESTGKTAEEERNKVHKTRKQSTHSNQIHQALQTEELLSMSHIIQPIYPMVTSPISFRSGEQRRWQPMRQSMRQCKDLSVQASQTSLRQSSCSYEFDFSKCKQQQALSKSKQQKSCWCRKQVNRISPLQESNLLGRIKQRCSKSRSCSPCLRLVLQSTQPRQTEKRFELQKKWRGVLGEQIIRKKYKKGGWR